MIVDTPAQTGTGTETVLEVLDLHVTYDSGSADRAAVLDGVTFSIGRSEHVGLVGESGAGKSTVAKAIMGLLPRREALVEGSVLFRGEDLLSMTEADINRIRGDRMSLIPQDASVALNPVLTVGVQMREVLRTHKASRGRESQAQVLAALRRVGLADPERITNSYAASLSGGMKQRVGIAMSLMMGPDLIVADEPTSAVDVTIQAQILAELRELTDRLHSSTLLITHDLRVVAALCTRLVVLYAGQVAEIGAADRLLTRPKHPYTAALIACSPSVEHRTNPLPTIAGAPGDATRLTGCRFHTRCPRATARCSDEVPPKRVDRDSVFACWNPIP